jgi:cytochrome c551/c552
MASCGVENSTAPRKPELDAVSLRSAPEKASHFEGKNCMECHGPNGNGPGLFKVAGTVLTAQGKPNASATVELRTANQNGEVVLSLPTDKNGNFYSTEAIDLETVKRWVFVKGSSGNNGMPFPTQSGACNLCHTPSLRVVVD